MQIRDVGPERFSHGEDGMDWRQLLNRICLFLLGVSVVGIFLITMAVAF